MASGIDNAFLWTSAFGFTPLPLPSGGVSSQALGVSGDGTIVVGYYVDGSNAKHACAWIFGVAVKLNEIAATSQSEARGISTDGSTIVGRCVAPALTPVYWPVASDVPGDAVVLQFLNGGTSADAYGVSGNGAIIVGQATDGTNSSHQTAVKWVKATTVASNVSAGVNAWDNSFTYSINAYVTASDGGVYISTINNNLNLDPVSHVGSGWSHGSLQSSIAYCANADGSTIAGEFIDTIPRAFTNIGGDALTRAGMDALLSVSANGAQFSAVSKTGLQAGAWSAGGGLINLPGVTGSGSNFSPGISSDGTRIVGQNVGDTGSFALQACYWQSPFNGPVTLMGVMPGGSYTFAWAASTDGSVIVGWGDFANTFLPTPASSAPPVGVNATNQYATPLTADPLSDKDVRVVLDTEWTTEGEWCLLQSYPLPVTVLATIPEIEEGDTPIP